MSVLIRPALASIPALALLAALSGTAPAAAQELPAAAAPGRLLVRAPAPLVEQVTATGYRVRVPIGEARVERGRIAGYDLAEILIPGGDAEGVRGTPSLPTRTLLLRIPWDASPSVRGTRAGTRSLGTLLPAPAPGLVTEPEMMAGAGVDARALVAAMEAAPFRALGGSGDLPALAAATPMAAGSARYLSVILRPVSWDPLTREARVAEEIVLEVSWDVPATPLADGRDGAASAARRLPAGEALRAAALDIDAAVGPRYPLRPSGTPGFGARFGRVPASPARAAVSGPLRVDPSRPWVRVGAVRPGLHRITAADLAAAGVAVGSIDPATFRLFRSTPGDLPESLDVDAGPDSLRECAIAVTGEGDGSFDAPDAIYFYATGESGFGYDLRAGGGPEYQETQRTDEQPHWLTWGAGPLPTAPRRIASRDAAPVTPALTPITQVTHRVHYEENRFPAFDLFQPPLRWERWFMSLISVTSFSSPVTRLIYAVSLPGAVPDGEAALRMRMWGGGAPIGSLPDHVARLGWNRAVVDTAGWNFLAPRDLEAAGLRTNGTRDTVQIEVPRLIDPADPGRNDKQYVAWFEVAYPRALRAIADTLAFAAPDSVPAGRYQYAITAVTDTAAAWLLDRTDPERPIRLVGGAWSGAAPSFTLTVEDSAGTASRRRYALLTASAPFRPSLARYAPAASPHSIADLLESANGADYLIVTPPAFVAAAESLAAYREKRLPGFLAPRAAIATTDRIAAQLGGGRSDPVAIRNLLVHASRRWTTAPLYLCLLGDASDDPKNYTRFSAPDLVPTYNEYFDLDVLQIQYISDDFFAFLGGPSDRLLDLAVGRLTARDPAEALALARGKNVVFDNAADFDWWRDRALLSADDTWQHGVEGTMRDPAGFEHVPEMEQADLFHIPFPIRREKVYLNDYPFADSLKASKPKARDAFIAAVNAGNWIVEYVGHGNEDFISDEQLFRSADLNRLTNASRPSIFGFFSCTVGKFDDNLRQDGLAELLQRYAGGGAVVSLAASNKAFGYDSAKLNDAFWDALFPFSPRVDSVLTAGLAWASAKNAPGNQNTTAQKYGYLGDPAVTPPLPRGRGVFEKGPLDSIPRGDLAVIPGHALLPDNASPDSSDGTVLLEVLGPPSRRIEFALQNGTLVAIPYLLPGPVLYRGETPLQNGAFTLRFRVPTDGRVIGTAQLRALLSEAGGEGVGLAADSLRISASLSARVDATPPTIRLVGPAAGDTTVAPGSILTFEIEDSSGVDLTRLDDAHAIFVIVDDRGTPIDLTSTFRYEPSSVTRGTATLTLPPLAAGAHLLEVHASDTYRNVATATFTIDVGTAAAPGTALTMTEVFNYPNPFPRETYLHARLNQSARLRVQILTVSGRRVRDFAIEGKAGENYIPWDGRDSQGENVALGVYIVKLTAETPGGNRVSAVARALRAE